MIKVYSRYDDFVQHPLLYSEEYKLLNQFIEYIKGVRETYNSGRTNMYSHRAGTHIELLTNRFTANSSVWSFTSNGFYSPNARGDNKRIPCAVHGYHAYIVDAGSEINCMFVNEEKKTTIEYRALYVFNKYKSESGYMFWI